MQFTKFFKVLCFLLPNYIFSRPVSKPPSLFLCYSNCPLSGIHALCFKCSQFFKDPDLYLGKMSLTSSQVEKKIIERPVLNKGSIFNSIVLDEDILDDTELENPYTEQGSASFADGKHLLFSTTVSSKVNLDVNQRTSARFDDNLEQHPVARTAFGFREFSATLDNSSNFTTTEQISTPVLVKFDELECHNKCDSMEFNKRSVRASCDETRESGYLLVSFKTLLVSSVVCTIAILIIAVLWQVYSNRRRVKLFRRLGRIDVEYRNSRECYVIVTGS